MTREVCDRECEYYNNKRDVLIKAIVIGCCDAEYF